MQILKDTAALVIVLLLALTLRIDTGRNPIDLELTPPVEAAESGTPESAAALPSAGLADITKLAEDGSVCAERAEPRRLLVIEQHLESVPQALRGLRRLPQGESWTIEIAPEAEPAACRTIHDPGLSC